MNIEKKICAIAASVIIILVGVFENSCHGVDIPKKTAKRAKIKPKLERDFSSFVKEREFLDDPYEIASKEAEDLLNFIERVLIPANDNQLNRSWEKDYIAGLRKGNGEYELIMPGVYLVKSGFAIYVADTKASKYTEISFGYDLEVKEQGVMQDGTGWVLCRYGGLSHGFAYSGYNLITYIDNESKTNVKGSNLISETIGYSENDPPEESIAYYCGKGEGKINGVAGEILYYFWKDVNNDGDKELLFKVREVNCSKAKSKFINKTVVFSISSGSVAPVK